MASNAVCTAAFFVVLAVQQAHSAAIATDHHLRQDSRIHFSSNEAFALRASEPDGIDLREQTRQHFALTDASLDASSESRIYDGGPAGRQPVSPALRCVTLISIAFFAVYLAAVVLRISRLVAQLAGKKFEAASFEAGLSQVTEAMTLAPMLCVLMISARLRALQLLPGSDPEWYVQGCMYTSTVAFFLRIILSLAFVGENGLQNIDGPLAKAAKVMYCVISFVLHSSACCILVLGTLAEGDGTGRRGGWSVGPALSPMVRCIALLAATFLAQCALFEVIGGLRRHFAVKVAQEQAGCSLAEQLSVRFPIMICVLLVGIELRAVQLGLIPEFWMSLAMYLTVFSIIAQVAWASIVATFGSWHPLGMPAAHEKSDDDEEGASRFQQVAVMVSLGVLLSLLYAGTATVLISVFVMEEKPLGMFAGFTAIGAYRHKALDTRGASGLAVEGFAAAPPLSTAMRCVMVLTVVYFASYLCLILVNMMPGNIKRWAKSVNDGLQGALAFVPMLCVLMIAVRLRAMQLRVRDPQQWAQTTMYIATLAINLQVVCCYLVNVGSASGDASEDEGDFEDSKQASSSSSVMPKIIAIIVLAVRHLSALILYVCMAVLVVALLSMEPALLS